MELKQQRVPTGTFCGGNHPEQIEYRYALVNGEEIPHGQSRPRCFRAALAKEQRGAAS